MARGMGAARSGLCRHGRCTGKPRLVQRQDPCQQARESLGEFDLGNKLRAEAQTLQSNFEAAFWCEDLGAYALALDGRKQPCRVRTSNSGHALFSGIASPERATRVAQTLLS
jgi:glycogen debranching enzyme